MADDPIAGCSADDFREIAADIRRERDEALAREATLAGILERISASPSDLAPALDIALQEVDRACDADYGIFWRFDGALFHAASARTSAEFASFLQSHPQRPPAPSDLGRLLRGEPFIHREDYAVGKVGNPSLNRATVELGGCRAGLLLPFRKGHEVLGAIRVFRKEPRPFSNEQIELAKRLAARFAAVAALSRMLGNSTILGIADALDSVHQPAVALDGMGFVLGANAAAEALWDGDVRIISRRLMLRDKGASIALSTLLNQMHATGDAAAFGDKPIVVRREGRPPLLLRVLPIGAVANNPFHRDLVFLAVTDLAPKPAPDPAVIARVFSLTRAEARLASLLATGMSPDAAARQLGVSPGTVRSQLKAVFAKTETHRQSELAALLARLS